MKIHISVKLKDDNGKDIQTAFDPSLYVILPFTELDGKANSLEKTNPGRFVHDFFLECIKIFRHDKQKKFNHGKKLPRHFVWSPAFTTALYKNDHCILPEPEQKFFLDI